MKKQTSAEIVMGSNPPANTDGELPKPEIVSLTRYQPEAQAALGQAAEVLGYLQALPINDQTSHLFEQTMLAAKERWKELEARRKTITGPIDAAKAAVQALFKPALDSWAGVEQQAKHKIAEWVEAKESERRAAELAAAEAFRTGAAPAVVQALVTASGEAPGHEKGVSTHKQWYADVVDAKALMRAVLDGKAPANLVVIDDAALQAYARATKGTAELPGVEFKTKTVVSGRS